IDQPSVLPPSSVGCVGVGSVIGMPPSGRPGSIVVPPTPVSLVLGPVVPVEDAVLPPLPLVLVLVLAAVPLSPGGGELPQPGATRENVAPRSARETGSASSARGLRLIKSFDAGGWFMATRSARTRPASKRGPIRAIALVFRALSRAQPLRCGVRPAGLW